MRKKELILKAVAEHYYLFTMGCQMNERDSQTIAGVLERLGLERTEDPAQARVAVLNTCAVRAKPEHKVFSRLGELGRLKQERSEMIIVVCGCVAQIAAEEIRRRAPFVDVILGPRNLACLEAAIARALAGAGPLICTDLTAIPDDSLPAARPPGVSAYVNISVGCNNYCAYCIVPYARGPEIYRPVEAILREIESLLQAGYREITLLGQNVNSYQGIYEKRGRQELIGFPQLLRLVGASEGLWRLRFTTSHPKDLSEELLIAMAETPAVCEHLHLPLQSGDDEILVRMGRQYTMAHYKRLVARARALMPNLALTTDLMVGFPGETEAQFENTLRAVEEIRFDQAFMFKYNDRPGTRAAAMPDKVPEREKQRRLERLVALQNDIAKAINVAQVGQSFEVLVEGYDEKDAQKLRGRTRQNKLMIFPGPAEWIGCLVNIRAVEGYLWGFRGEAIEPAKKPCPETSLVPEGTSP